MNISIGNRSRKLLRRADAQPLAGNARGGFSLVELLMVLCVLVVLTSLSLPATLRWQRGMPLEQAISILQIQIQETRLAAIRSGEPWSLVLPQPGIAGRRHPTDEPAAHAARSNFQWPAGVQCHDMQTQQLPKPVLFRPDGTVSGRLLRLADSNGHQTFLQIDRLTGSASVRQNPSPTINSDHTLGKSGRQQNGTERISRGPLFSQSPHVAMEASSC